MSNELIRTMFKHLLKTYTLEETRSLLVTKFPEATEFVNNLMPDDFKDEVKVQEAKTARIKSDKVVKEKKPTKRSGNTKNRALELYNNSTDKSRKVIIKLFTDELGLVATSASNLYHWCKKELSS